MAMNSSIKNSRLLITGTLLHHKHQLRDFFNRYAIYQQLPFRADANSTAFIDLPVSPT
jgi:hypothetical protein